MTEIVRNRHYAQGSTSVKRKAALAQRRANGEAEMPHRPWRKGHGTHAQMVATAKALDLIAPGAGQSAQAGIAAAKSAIGRAQ